MKEYILVFLFGGLMSLIAQIIIDKTSLTPARILVGYVVSGVILTAAGAYKYAVEYFKSGASVPLTGFGYSLAKGVVEAINERGFIGIFTGGLSGTSAGIAAAILFSALFALIFSGKPEKL